MPPRVGWGSRQSIIHIPIPFSDDPGSYQLGKARNAGATWRRKPRAGFTKGRHWGRQAAERIASQWGDLEVSGQEGGMMAANTRLEWNKGSCEWEYLVSCS